MQIYNVTVRTVNGRFPYTAIGASSCDVAAAAIDLFGLCGVFVSLVRTP